MPNVNSMNPRTRELARSITELLSTGEPEKWVVPPDYRTGYVNAGKDKKSGTYYLFTTKNKPLMVNIATYERAKELIPTFWYDKKRKNRLKSTSS